MSFCEYDFLSFLYSFLHSSKFLNVVFILSFMSVQFTGFYSKHENLGLVWLEAQISWFTKTFRTKRREYIRKSRWRVKHTHTHIHIFWHWTLPRNTYLFLCSPHHLLFILVINHLTQLHQNKSLFISCLTEKLHTYSEKIDIGRRYSGLFNRLVFFIFS